MDVSNWKTDNKDISWLITTIIYIYSITTFAFGHNCLVSLSKDMEGVLVEVRTRDLAVGRCVTIDPLSRLP